MICLKIAINKKRKLFYNFNQLTINKSKKMTPITSYSCNTTNQAENSLYLQIQQDIQPFANYDQQYDADLQELEKIIQPLAELNPQKVIDLSVTFPKSYPLHRVIYKALAKANQTELAINLLLDFKTLPTLDSMTRSISLPPILLQLEEERNLTGLNQAIKQMCEERPDEAKKLCSAAFFRTSQELMKNNINLSIEIANNIVYKKEFFLYPHLKDLIFELTEQQQIDRAIELIQTHCRKDMDLIFATDFDEAIVAMITALSESAETAARLSEITDYLNEPMMKNCFIKATSRLAKNKQTEEKAKHLIQNCPKNLHQQLRAHLLQAHDIFPPSNQLLFSLLKKLPD